jgi:hypothetical protein
MNTVIDSAVTETLLYHEQTKHHFHRSARSLGFLDWANQPNPFRFYEGVTAVRLPLLQNGPPAWPKHSASGAPLEPVRRGEGPASEHLALYERSRNAFRDFTGETIGAFLELSLGLSAWKSIPGNSWALRMNPSSGNLHPTEAYLILPRTTQSSVDVVRAAAFNSRLSECGKRSDGRRRPCAPLSRW